MYSRILVAVIMSVVVILIIVLMRSNSTIDLTRISNFSSVSGLEDCAAWDGTVGGHSALIIRCPNSTTSTKISSGKTMNKIITIDGEQYELTKVEK